MRRGLRHGLLWSLFVMTLAGCAGLPPGADYVRNASTALVDPHSTRLGARVATLGSEHPGLSGFRIVSVGVDGFLTRAQIIDTAEKTLDLQYYIYRGDETGRLLNAALLRAAERGVRIRLLVDDGESVSGDERVMALDEHPMIEVRVFNPFAYRGHSSTLRGLEYLFKHARLDYRMHNKLLVVDNAVAMVGGRNIGNQYFQMDPESQFADDDVFVVGPLVTTLSASFDEFWNSPLAIPAPALSALAKGSPPGQHEQRRKSKRHAPELDTLQTDGVDYGLKLASGEPYAGMLSGRLPLVWARAEVLSDSPGKRQVVSGSAAGRLLMPEVTEAARAVQTELIVVTPYFVPLEAELQLFAELRSRHVRVRVLTNSLESASMLLAHSGYAPYRAALLERGVELNEVRSLLSYARGSGQTNTMSGYGNYALHAKLYIFDRQRLFIGSMNFDQRSKHLNTEIGVMIDSPLLAQQTAERFEAMTEPQNSYVLALRAHHPGDKPGLIWQTREAGQMVEYWHEPARRRWHRLMVRLLALLPIESEL